MSSEAPVVERPTHTTNGSRPLPRRRPAPNGRAAMGAFLVATAIVLLFAIGRDRSQADLARYVVARHQLAVGTPIAPGDLATVRLHLPAGPLRERLFLRPGPLIGSVVVAPLGPGDLIQASAVVRSTDHPGLRQISVPIESARALGNRLRPGETVDVVATFGTGADAFTITVVTAVRVVARDPGDSTLGANKEVVVLAVTTAADAAAVANAIAAGQISLVRVSGVEPAVPGAYRPTKPSAAP